MRLDSWRRTTHEMDVRPSSKLNINIEVNTSLYFPGVFSLFSIVQFPNLRCTSSTSSTTYGTCLTRLCPRIHYCLTRFIRSFIHSLISQSSRLSTALSAVQMGGLVMATAPLDSVIQPSSKVAICNHAESPHPDCFRIISLKTINVCKYNFSMKM